jgi:cytochrome c oxidase subunit 2
MATSLALHPSNILAATLRHSQKTRGGFVKKGIVVCSLACFGFAAIAGARSQEGDVKVIEVSAKKYAFTPAEIRVQRGAKVRLTVHSVDETHGIKLSLYPEGAKDKSTPGLQFAQPEQNGKVEKNTDQVLEFTAVTPGTYEFKCAKICGMGHGHMKGRLIVEP